MEAFLINKILTIQRIFRGHICRKNIINETKEVK